MLLAKLGKYRIISWLGGGAFGDVYLAEDTLIGKNFAIKVSKLKEKDIKVLKSEAQILASLDHPNIARFYNLDIIEGKLVLVIEYVEGDSLRSLLEYRRIKIEEIPQMFFPVLDALSYAHSNGVVHRDIKPENILISKDGSVKLVDFGLGAFIRAGSVKATAAGTPVYMAPESWSGVFLPSSDIYSLGVVIYESLTGKNPFDGDTLEEIRKKVFEVEPKPLDFYLPSASQELSGVLSKALSKKIEFRYADALSFKEALSRALKLDRSVEVITTKKSYFSTVELQLTPCQHDVVFSPAKRILLVGGAGTGKTTTLLYRLYKKLMEGKDPSTFLVLSFTKKAVLDLRERLSRLLGKDPRDLWIETFHGAIYRILKREAERIGFSQDFSLVSDSFPIFKEATEGIEAPLLNRIFSEISVLRSKLISPEESLRTYKFPWHKKVSELYFKFSELKKKKNIMDFDDLIFYGVKLLEEDDLREIYSGRFKFIFVDELQDLNEAQYRFIKLLSSDDSELFLTGDATQSIYRWRGAIPNIINRAEEELRLKRYELTHSFRLPKRILSLASSLMIKEGIDLSNIVSLRGEGKVELYIAKDEADEARFVVQKVKELSLSRKLSSIGIFYRFNHQSRIVEELLAQLRLPYRIVGGSRFYEREEVKMVVSYLRGLLERDFEAIGRFFSWILGFKKSRFKASTEGLFLEEGSFSKRKKAERLLDFLKSFLESGKLTVEELLRIPLEIAEVFKRREKGWVSYRDGFLELLKLASSFDEGSLKDFLNHISLMEEMGLGSKGEALNLLTFHSAKGLEFDVVFITGLYDGNVPYFASLARLEELEEERRLLFVALTRATEHLYLSYPRRVDGKGAEPSRFLLEMIGML
ncbi:MAG: UvrD-helicase domain-containing protein [Synergistetes bacterium]|nr:UvrD-helicase domain-containing protein [Synergistota bacterium]MCX8127390.1 UvrD-helicase domain-containing protein [Synergistota bacterium]MDW8192254.1 UvrD-helicase domain-containing protein [Synergistota bacterium]